MWKMGETHGVQDLPVLALIALDLVHNLAILCFVSRMLHGI
jgi:hypothetical protein